MRTSAVIAALLGVLVAGSARENLAWGKKRAQKSAALDASACPEFSQATDPTKRAITFQLDNRCAQAIHCSIGWRVSCPGGDGGGAHEESIDIDGKARGTAEASASACGDGSWRISAAEWKCHFQPDPGDTASR
jgi:hypothetical protein